MEVFRDVVRVVNPAELTTSDLLAVVSLLQRSINARGATMSAAELPPTD